MTKAQPVGDLGLSDREALEALFRDQRMNEVHLRAIAAQLARMEVAVDCLCRHLGLPEIPPPGMGPLRYVPLLKVLYARFGGAGFTCAEAIADRPHFEPLRRVLDQLGCHTAVSLSGRLGGIEWRECGGYMLRKISRGGGAPTKWVVARVGASAVKAGRSA